MPEGKEGVDPDLEGPDTGEIFEDHPELAPPQGRITVDDGVRHAASGHRDWTAVLGRLGGSSPGSEENLALAGHFGNVQFPATHEDVLKRLKPEAEFRFREGIAVDLGKAVESARKETFRNMNDLIDCVKDELRRAERSAPAG